MVVACVNEDWQEPGQSTLADPLVTVELREGREHKQVEFLVVRVETYSVLNKAVTPVRGDYVMVKGATGQTKKAYFCELPKYKLGK